MSIDLSPAVLDIWFKGGKGKPDQPRRDVPVKPVDVPDVKPVQPVAEIKPAVVDPVATGPAPVVIEDHPVPPLDIPVTDDKCPDGKPKRNGRCHGQPVASGPKPVDETVITAPVLPMVNSGNAPDQVVPVSADTIVPAITDPAVKPVNHIRPRPRPTK